MSAGSFREHSTLKPSALFSLLRIPVTRDELLELNADYFERVTAPIEMALNAGGMTREEIHEVILVGAGTRVPKVQEKLGNFRECVSTELRQEFGDLASAKLELMMN